MEINDEGNLDVMSISGTTSTNVAIGNVTRAKASSLTKNNINVTKGPNNPNTTTAAMEPHTRGSGDNTKTVNTRHGARNQHRHKQLCKWIMDSYNLQAGDLVLDVAGGKGELAARLTMCHQLHVLLVDPRLADIPQTFERVVLPKLPKRHQARFQERTKDNPSFLNQILDERFQQLVICFDDSTVQSNTLLRDALRKCKLIIGMHADGATECIVDVALRFHKPFVVIPCCVFPNLFQQRFVMENSTNAAVDDTDDTNTNENGEVAIMKKVRVRNHEQFCRYLLEKDRRFQKEVLPFEGRNVAILWDADDTDGKD